MIVFDMFVDRVKFTLIGWPKMAFLLLNFMTSLAFTQNIGGVDQQLFSEHHQTSFSTAAVLANKSIPLQLNYLFYMESRTSHGDGTYPLRDILVDAVNSNASILSKFNVSIQTYDTMFNVDYNLGRTIELFTHYIANASHQQPNQCFTTTNTTLLPSRIAPLFFGPEYSSEAKVVAQVAPFYNLIQISSVANAPDLANHAKYPTFFRTCMSSNEYVQIPRALMTYFNYSRVALVSFDDTYASEPMQKIDYELHSHNYDVLFNVKMRPSDNATLDRLMHSIRRFDARIIFLWSGDLEDYRIFCRAMKGDDGGTEQNAAGAVIQPGKQLIISLGLDDAAAVLDPELITDSNPRCTREKLAEMLNGTLLAVSPPWASTSDTLDFGLFTRGLIDKAEEIGRNRYGHPTGRINRYAPLLVDAFWLGFLALDAVDRRLQRESPPRSLTDFTFSSSDIASMLKEEITKVHFRGANGNIAFSAAGERKGQISIQQYRPGAPDGPFVDVFHVSTDSGRLEFISAPVFNTGNNLQPPDREPPPPTDSRYSSVVTITVVVSCVALLCIVLICTTILYIYKRAALARQLARPVWLIDSYSLVMRSAGLSLMSINRQSTMSMDHASRPYSMSTSAQTALLDDQVVRVQVLPLIAKRLSVNPQTHKVMSAFRDSMLHGNLVRFVGYCVESPLKLTVLHSVTEDREQYLLWEHCEKGSLEQLIENDALKLDSAFECAIIQDIAQGMTFLHKSFVGVHGALCAAACCIDRRFSVKVADYGDKLLAPLFGVASIAEERENLVWGFDSDGEDYENVEHTTSLYGERKLYWSPELLRSPVAQPTPADDVYAYAITVYVLLTRSAPFESHGLLSHKVLKLVRQSNRSPAPFRPETQHQLQHCDRRLVQLLQRCWAENPIERPPFTDIVRQIRIISGLKASNSSVTDQLLRRLERYASDMESLVQERTRELDSEKRRSDELLNAMLPPQVAEELKQSGQVQPESFDSVSIYFSDIVGFTTLSSSSTPIEVVNLLNGLYTLFDAHIDLYDAYKVETIGDAYMVVSGLPKRNEMQHIGEIGRLALDLLKSIGTFVIPHRPTETLSLRVGLHTGPCVAGVVGIKMPRYCLFGDTINTASRMESTGKAMRIHISDAMKQAMDEAGVQNFVTVQRGMLEVKGKGTMLTYWLLSDEADRNGYNDMMDSQINVRQETSHII